MNKLHCDMGIRGSLSTLIEHQLKCGSHRTLQEILTKQLTRNARTVPARYGRRCAALVGVVYDQFEGDPKLLDTVIGAILDAEKSLKRGKNAKN